ncbi:MAG: hypothetical protein M3R09_06920, partial [Actinomycetota bacterium]|nr:hypothetical protein [Actinomycetota bacterium]
TGQHHPSQGHETVQRHGFHPLPHRGAAVSNAFIDRLREEGPE